MSFLTRPQQFCYQRRSCCAPCPPFDIPPPCFGGGQRLSTCALTGPLVPHAPTSVACVLGSVTCAYQYFCRMRLVHIELSELERARGFPLPFVIICPEMPAAALVLYIYKGTEDESLGGSARFGFFPPAAPPPPCEMACFGQISWDQGGSAGAVDTALATLGYGYAAYLRHFVIYTYCAVCVKHSPLRDDSALRLYTLSYMIRLFGPICRPVLCFGPICRSVLYFGPICRSVLCF
jgi:hypothetical protein